MSLENKVAMITGAGRGIGQAIALNLAKAGADIVSTDVVLDLAEETKKLVEALGRKSIALQADVSNAEQMEELAGKIMEEFPTLDILVNNAGITRDGLLMRMSPEDWRKVFAVNMDGMFYVTRSVIRTMIKQKRGKIINIASVVGFTGNPGQINYSSAKSAVVGFTKSIARELGSRNITCNAVAPGFIETDMTRELNEDQQKAILSQVPLGRMGTAEEVAQAVGFLAGEESDYITGTIIHVNGGMF